MMFRWLFAAFLAVPLIEIYLLLTVGSLIGVLPTIVLIVFTAVLGVTLIRIQGLITMARLQEKLQRHELPADELLAGAALLVAGALLLTPGFFTDTIGFLLLVPVIRRWIASQIATRWAQRVVVVQGGTSESGPRQADILEGEYKSDD